MATAGPSENTFDILDGMAEHKHKYMNRITRHIVPSFLGHMRDRANGYPADSHLVLGARGEYTHIWRKSQLLKEIIWDGREAIHESPEEILLDLIGHCFLTLDALQQEQKMASINKPDPNWDEDEMAIGVGSVTFPTPQVADFNSENAMPEANSIAPLLRDKIPSTVIATLKHVADDRVITPEERTRVISFLNNL